MKKTLSLLLIIFTTTYAFSQVEFIINSLPSNTPNDTEIFIAGDFNGWQPGNNDYKLTKNSDNLYSIIIEEQGSIEFKFTRGSWETCEGTEGGTSMSNRRYTFTNDTIVYFTIKGWEDHGGGGSVTHTTTDNTAVMNSSFYIPQLDKNRRIWIYLPPDYSTSEKEYPVLYMHDAQNLFDEATSFMGEWGVDESLNTIAQQGKNVPIVIGIDNGGSDRIDELTPWANTNYGGGNGDAYTRFIVETLKPYVDQNYRTLSDRDNTGIMGSSLGGLISFYAGLEYQDTFGKVGVFSPSFWFSDTVYTFASEKEKQYESKIYFLAGLNEGENHSMVNNMQQIYDTLRNNNYSEEEMHFTTPADGQHSEWFWKREFPAAYEWLFKDYLLNTSDSEIRTLNIYPNPTNNNIKITMPDNKVAHFSLFDTKGNKILKKQISQHETICFNNISKGIYIACITSQNYTYTNKLIIQ